MLLYPYLLGSYEWYSNIDRFSDTHAFEKPNDVRALELMDKAAMTVMQEYKDVVLAFGESDEYRQVVQATYLRVHV